MPTSQPLLTFKLTHFYPYLKMSCSLIFVAMDAQLCKWTSEQYYVQWKIEIMCMLLIAAFLSFFFCNRSFSLCGEVSGLSMLGRSLLHSPQGVIQEAGHSDAIQARLGYQHVLSQSVWRYSYLRIPPLPGAPAYPCISILTLEKLSDGHLLFLPPP